MFTNNVSNEIEYEREFKPTHLLQMHMHVQHILLYFCVA